MKLEGRLPGKVRCGARASTSAAGRPASSARTSASLRPTIRASAWAMAFASSLVRAAGGGRPLAVRFHLQLLQEGGEQAQALGVGDHRADRPAEAIAVEDVSQR